MLQIGAAHRRDGLQEGSRLIARYGVWLSRGPEAVSAESAELSEALDKRKTLIESWKSDDIEEKRQAKRQRQRLLGTRDPRGLFKPAA